MEANQLKSRIEEFFQLQGTGLEEYKLSPKSADDANECFMNDLGFGTAGLRSEMDVGFNRMNEVTVRIAAMGIGRYLKQKHKDGTTVIIGYDHRHNSKLFAQTSAQVYRSYGLKVRMFPEIVPTPFVPSALQCFKDEVGLGVMVTASHNPRKDNGYKVYGGNGAQIVDSVAKEICECIRGERGRYGEIKTCAGFEIDLEDSEELMESVSEWYIAKLSGFLNIRSNIPLLPLIVYTPLHGVGGDYVDRIFRAIFGDSSSLHHVPEQRRPDPDFPTVDFPNPEEGASTLWLAMREAERLGIRHVFANDPDADRFCVAEREEESGNWRIFNGNEIAVLLADFIAGSSDLSNSRCAMLASCVSSRFLQQFCSRRGWQFESTSTGFKNLGNRAIQLKHQEGMRVLFAYEEAIGFQVGDWNFDKDGISAMMTFYAMLCGIQDCRDNGRDSKCDENNITATHATPSTIQHHLRCVYEREGVWPVQYNGYYICKPVSRIKAIIRSIRNCFYEDCVFTNDGSVVTVEFPSKRAWLMLRSSGTEPKLKYYSEMLGEREAGEDKTREFEAMMRGIIETMIQPEQNGFK